MEREHEAHLPREDDTGKRVQYDLRVVAFLQAWQAVLSEPPHENAFLQVDERQQRAQRQGHSTRAHVELGNEAFAGRLDDRLLQIETRVVELGLELVHFGAGLIDAALAGDLLGVELGRPIQIFLRGIQLSFNAPDRVLEGLRT